MKIIVEGPGNRFFRITVPDGCKITWQAPNPTKQSNEQCLRIYEGQKQIMVIPEVYSWRRDDIQVEEWVQPLGVIGRAWKDKGDGPMFSEESKPELVQRNKDEQAGEVLSALKKRW